jgi:hypothetical protein
MVCGPSRTQCLRNLLDEGAGGVYAPRDHAAAQGLCGRPYLGVYRDRSKWAAHIRYRGKRLYIGSFDDEVEAAKARDRKAYELHGEFAYLNLPEDFGR